jgi:hypothetical protein
MVPKVSILTTIPAFYASFSFEKSPGVPTVHGSIGPGGIREHRISGEFH